jgi:uncharacterized phiE125 gp8 family phage protein
MIPRVELVSIAGTEPVTAALLKAQLRITNAQEIDLLAGIGKAARTKAENYTGRTIIKKTLRMWLDRPPGGKSRWFNGTRQAPISSVENSGAVEIPSSPVQSVEYVKSYSNTDVETIADPSDYFLDNVDKMRPARLCLRLGAIWPISLRLHNGFSVDYTAGYSDGAVPDDLQDALQKLAAWLFTHRGDYTDEKAIRDAGAYAGLDDYVFRKITA